MAYYNANRVIELTRKAMGISQETLSDGICDVSTLSRMENGHFRIKRSTYRKLMEKMGREVEKRYVVCVDKNGAILDIREEWERAYKSQDYERAEEILHKMQENADDNLLTSQYLARAEALIEYRLKRITAEEMIQRVDKAIRMTVPDYEKYLFQEKVFPFVEEELLALVSLGNGYRAIGENERGLQMYEAVLRCLKADYMCESDRIELQIKVAYNVVRVYATMGKHVEAIAEIDLCLKMCRERDYSHMIVRFLVAKAHNYVRMIERKEWGAERLEEIKKLLQQACSLAAAREEAEMMKKISEYYKAYLEEYQKIFNNRHRPEDLQRA